mgnify:CR=1 FL=1
MSNLKFVPLLALKSPEFIIIKASLNKPMEDCFRNNLGKRRLEEVSNGVPELNLVPVMDHLGVVVKVAGPQPGIKETTHNKGEHTPPARCTLTFNTTPSTPETICS